jgi:ABC-2 type transport system permease protein
MAGLLEMLFLSNCNEFAELVRTGDLDFFLLKPVDEQFMVSCRNVDWSCAPNVMLGGGVMVYALWGTSVPVLSVLLFLAMFVCGVAMAYGFLLMLTAASVWFMRNQSLMEMWWLFGTLMRYPREIFLRTAWVSPVGLIFSTVIPIMLVTNVPARVIVSKLLEWWAVPYTALASVAGFSGRRCSATGARAVRNPRLRFSGRHAPPANLQAGAAASAPGPVRSNRATARRAPRAGAPAPTASRRSTR